MKILNSFLLFLILFSAYTYADETDSLASNNINEFGISTGTYLTLVFDPGLTMRSGAENVITIQNGLARTEDRLIGTRWFSEKGLVGKTGGIVCRYAKYALIDLPVDWYSIVFAHEYLGHGARYRELDIEKIHYAFDMPPPYGGGGGEASANIGPGVINDHEVLGIWIGGVEVHSILNKRLSLRWMAKREIQYREASVYFWAWQIMFSYIQDTNEDLTTKVNDNDISAYVRIINRHNGYTDYDNLPMDVKDLKSRTMIDVANPFLFYTLFTIMKTYFWDGNNSTGLPMPNIKGVGYIPSLRTGLTPFGLEYHLENYLRFENKVSLIDLRIGDQTFHNSWGGVGLLIQNMYENERFSLDMNLDVWSQPEIEIGGDPVTSKGGGFGGAFSLRGYYDFAGSQYPISAMVELGYKSPGFLEGYVLDASPIIMVGIGLRN
ncbi:hypothetical protein E3J62_08130 [candidate division TA06 bacterium]|uniref:Uncharacterized protein n=1 Tax=candidate division TA06 bacterium TaxID=2250710 RepID=A0A523URS1_UNCT6|nr:MAG: hypothetical protein E3J62_08130 [candidate division TA06 bacterium]